MVECATEILEMGGRAMITDLKPYPAMKDSGVPWLGAVPAHWSLGRTKTVLRERVQKGFADEPLLAATQTKGVVRKERYESRTVLALKDLHLLKLVRVGDYVISLRSFQGGIEYAREQGIISPAYTVLYAVQPDMHGFLAWLFKSNPYLGNLSLFVTGIRQGQNIDYEKLSRSELPLPPLPEQATIVRFLNRADWRIRRYIGAKQKLIKLLEEQKQAIVHRSVTRGLNPMVRLKPSGVEWLGAVPEHWEVWQIGHFAQVGNGSTPSRGNLAYWSGGHYPWLNSSYANRESITHADQFVTDAALRECHLPIVPSGSVLVAITGQGKTRGKVAVLRMEATINQHIAYITPREQIASADYVRLALHGAYAQLRAISDNSGSTKGALTCADLKHFRLALPSLSEQITILESVEIGTRTCSTAIDRAQREISLLREYRTRLIADIVTGKLDVCEAAANLPDEADEPEAPDDTEALDEDDESAAGELDLAPAEDDA
jgi:type I restriction enzyme S subunit